jgi:hypothetical protein
MCFLLYSNEYIKQKNNGQVDDFHVIVNLSSYPETFFLIVVSIAVCISRVFLAP